MRSTCFELSPSPDIFFDEILIELLFYVRLRIPAGEDTYYKFHSVGIWK